MLRAASPVLPTARLLASDTDIPVTIEAERMTMKIAVPAGQVEAALLYRRV
jgi:hypothetical protein